MRNGVKNCEAHHAIQSQVIESMCLPISSSITRYSPLKTEFSVSFRNISTQTKKETSWLHDKLFGFFSWLIVATLYQSICDDFKVMTKV